MKTACLIPARNAQEHLAECLESTYEFDRVLLLDDASTDDTYAIASEFAHAETHRSPFHLGASSCRNWLFDQVRDCEVIAFLDSDDYRIDNLYRQLAQLQHCEVLISPLLIGTRLVSSQPDTLSALLRGNFQTGSLLFRRSSLERVMEAQGQLWREVPLYQEQFLVWDLFRTGARIGFGDRPVVQYRYRWHPNQITARANSLTRYTTYCQLANEVRAAYPTAPQLAVADKQIEALDYLLRRNRHGQPNQPVA